MSDLTEQQASIATKVTGASSAGAETNYLGVDSNQSAQVTLKDGSGNSITSTLVGSKQSLDVNVSAQVTTTDRSGTGTIVALSGTVVATTTGASTVYFNTTGTWTGILTIEGQDGNGNWQTTLATVLGSGNVTSALNGNVPILVPCGGFNQVRLRASTFTSGTATVNYNVGSGTNALQVFNLTASGLQTTTRLNDGSGNSISSTSSQLQTRDTINVSGQYRAQSVTTSAAEALGAGTILANRKLLSITPTNGTVYWGFSNAVTTTTGTPIFKNQTFTIATTDNVHVYLISAGTVDCRIAEAS